MTLKWLFLAMVLVGLTACTTVKPWQRDLLAKPQMALDSDPLQTSFDEHIYFSKEAS